MLLLSCEQKKRATQNTAAETDSISNWMAQAKSKDISLSNKSSLYLKAFDKTRLLVNDSLKISYLKELSFALRESPDSILFRRINKGLLSAAHKENDSTYLAEAYWDLGDFFNYHTVRDSAYYYFAEAENIFNEQDNQLYSALLLKHMAWVQNYIGDYTGSEKTAIKSLQKLKPLNNFRQLRSAYNLLADNAKLLNDYDQALEYYEESFSYLKKSGSSSMQEQTFKNNIGLVYQKKGQQDRAIEYFTEALSTDSLRYKRPRLYARCLNNLGHSYLQIENLDRLPQLFTEAIEIQDSINDLGGKTSTSYNLAAYHLIRQDTTAAHAVLLRAKELATLSSNNKLLLKIIQLFSKVDPQNATQYTQEYVALSDSLQNQERQIRNKFALIQFKTDEFIAENQLLTRQKQLWTGIAATLVLLGIASFIIINQRIRNQRLRFRQQQQASNQEIFNLMLAQNEKVEEGKKLEQKRVSEELHDGVLGRMLGIRMMLLGLNKKTDPDAIAERAKAISILQSIEGEVRSISHELSHAAYQKMHNFILSIEDLLRTIENTSKINIDLIYAEDLDWDALSGDIKINLYRIIQESIQNAVKHAESENITLNFGADSDHLRITIADDGKGFVVKKGKKGIGMRNIASRTKKVNGTWGIDSTLGKGTKVTLVIPIVASDNSKTIKIVQEDLQEF